MSKEINVGIVGTQFMGRSHSNAYVDVAKFFELPMKPAMQVACDINTESLAAFQARFGWKIGETSWKKMVQRDDVDLVDICTSNATHMPIAVAAAKNGKHVICEKPAALNVREARQMWDAAAEAGVVNLIAFNYRRVPALVLAQKLIQEGKLGKIYHFNAFYLQDWLVDPAFPMVWRHDKKVAGSGAHGDLNAHIIDQARFLIGEIEAVTGAEETFIKERPIAGSSGKGQVTVDDATQFIARFSNGAMGMFCSTRMASGCKNLLRLEIYGSEGGIMFNLERLNELQYYSRKDHGTVQGYRTIMVTEGVHPYINAWWPAGHIIGWEHTFIHEVRDTLVAIAKNKPVYPDFFDGLRCQQVLEAVSKSAASGKWVQIPEESR
jgi:predicted dehydrogenase